jgi:pimeloyl-ACP methyl ester carboxylesterase
LGFAKRRHITPQTRSIQVQFADEVARTGDDWQHIFAAPLDGYRVMTPDLRGHGRSTNPSGVFRFADVARDILALLDRLGINRVKAIGLSAGANTLLHMATLQPSRIDALIHVSGTPRFPEPARAIMRTMTEDGRSEAEWTGDARSTRARRRSDPCALGGTPADSPTIRLGGS